MYNNLCEIKIGISVRKVFYSLVFVLYTLFSPELYAVSGGDSILNIPKGTTFKLRYELEVPANQNFLYIGGNELQERLNKINQYFNQNKNNYYNSHNYFTYNSYLMYWQELVHQSYYSTEETLGSSNSVGSVLQSLANIGGDNFDIYLPDLEYFE